MAALLPPGVIQFCDADGHPYVGGTLDTFVASTTTPKTTWLDAGKAAANTNPIVLNAAGRATVFGDGLYRTVLKDAVGNLVFDALSSTLVSDAMAPVIIAPTIADALVLLGVQDAIDTAVAVETTRAEAAEAAETTRATTIENGLEAQIVAEIARAEAAEAANAAAIAAEITRAEAAEAALGALIAAGVAPPSGQTVQTGTAVSTGSGDFTVTFPTPFATNVTSFAITGPGSNLTAGSVLATLALVTGQLWQDVGLVLPGSLALSTTFTWRATGY